jgi:GWxTD domain-containing protein
MKRAICLLFILCLSGSVFPQILDRTGKETVTPFSAFFADIVSFGTNDSVKTRVDVLLEIPFTALKFYKDEDVFKAGYSATASISDSTGASLIEEKTWSGKLKVANFEATGSKHNFDVSLQSFMLVPGTYTAKISVEDNDSKKEISQVLKFRVKNLWKPLIMSDIVLITPAANPADKRLVPNVSRTINAKGGKMRLYFEAYADSVFNAKFQMEILGDKGNVFHRVVTPKKLLPGTNRMLYSFDTLNLAGGEYTIRVTMVDSAKEHFIDQTEKVLHARIPGLPLFVRDVDKAIDEMKYIASQTELDTLRSGKTPEERMQRFNEFWKKRDPSEATEENEVFDEYFRRVQYANANFSRTIDGWKTDMGMVYILLGSPDNIDRHPFEINSKPYEIWEYYQLNQRLVFLDSTGFGDYRLITPLTGDLYRYR